MQIKMIVMGVVLGVCTATAAEAQLAGDQATVTEFYPTLANNYGSSGPLVIQSGGTDFGAIGSSYIDILVTSSTITLKPLFGYTPQQATFNGFDIRDLNLATIITGASLASGTLPSTDLTFGPHDVFVNLAGVPVSPSSPIVINVAGLSGSLIGAVPEPASWAMMIAGFGMIGAGLRHRRRTVFRYT